ncbi:hypothetical protein SKAU_G00377360 [Synaphobranchus kaupii]|uniref:Uncharacterized protein n=1 Tax=Synaphobranchus kaupii TaxID=118154 RepID=A0A9Q1ED13_SYNKA|nr:hypothetical protein SKAU_G00377360 [Synaphobranchus kaupii]
MTMHHSAKDCIQKFAFISLPSQRETLACSFTDNQSGPARGVRLCETGIQCGAARLFHSGQMFRVSHAGDYTPAFLSRLTICM